MANKTVTIEVTADDVKQGQRVNSFSCPVALAARRAVAAVMPNPPRISAHWTGLSIGGDSIIEVPIEVKRFMFDFDFERPWIVPEPFDVEVPDDGKEI